MDNVLPVIVAVGNPEEASRLGGLLQRGGVSVVRTCEDLEDLLVTAATGAAEAVLLAADLAGLDRDALTRLRILGVGVVALLAPGDESAERRLHQWGVTYLSTVAEGAELVRALDAASAETLDGAWGFANPFGALPMPVPAASVGEDGRGGGQVVAVWGPTGAPGRTTVATHLAAELALTGWPTLLVDADVYGGTVAPRLGLATESSGLAAACRAANLGTLDVPALAALTTGVASSLWALTGLPDAQRWPELRPASVEVVLTLARTLGAVTVVDCGFCLEQDEELSYDTLAPRRNGATLAALESADLVLAVGSADRVGLQRLGRGLEELNDAVPDARTTVVVNRLATGGEAAARQALRRYVGVERMTVIPADPAVEAALRAGRTLAAEAPESAARQVLQGLAASLAGVRPAARTRRLLFR